MMLGGDQPPLEFPELVGLDGEEARQRIQAAHPELRVVQVCARMSGTRLGNPCGRGA